MSLWACGCYLVAVARSLVLGFSFAPTFTLFLLFNGALGAFFALNIRSYRAWWDWTESAAIVLQLMVSIEAYWILAKQIPNFEHYRWRVLAVIALVGVVVAAAFSLDRDQVHRWASFANQVAGLGLGAIALASLGASAPFLLSRNSRIHSGVIAAMWLSAGIGYRLGADVGLGRNLVMWVPAFAVLVWSLAITRNGSGTPRPDPRLLVKAHEALEESERRAASL